MKARKTVVHLASLCMAWCLAWSFGLAQNAPTKDSAEAGPHADEQMASLSATDNKPGVEAVANPDSVLSQAELDSIAGDIAMGKALFEGNEYFANGGPSCISCHNVATDDIISGGLLAKDLTHVFKRMGGSGIESILAAPPYPAMVNAYGSRRLLQSEINQLTAFLTQVEETAPEKEPEPEYDQLLIGGGIGISLWLGLIYIMFIQRKKRSVKHDIFKRQIRPF